MDLSGIEVAASKAGTAALYVGVVIIVMMIIMGLAGLFIWFYYFRYKRYKEYECIIYYKDGLGNLRKTFDHAGIFTKLRSKHKRLWLKRHNVGLTPDSFKYVMGDDGKKYVYLRKTGLKNFHFINVNVADPKVTLTVGEEDVNWALAEYDGLKRWNFKSILDWMPFITTIVVTICLMVVFIWFFKSFGDLSAAGNAMSAAAQALERTSENILAFQNSTLVVA